MVLFIFSYIFYNSGIYFEKKSIKSLKVTTYKFFKNKNDFLYTTINTYENHNMTFNDSFVGQKDFYFLNNFTLSEYKIFIIIDNFIDNIATNFFIQKNSYIIIDKHYFIYNILDNDSTLFPFCEKRIINLKNNDINQIKLKMNHKSYF